MDEARFQKLGIGENVIWPNGVEGRVAGIDEDDKQIMDECGGWHDFCDVCAAEYIY